MVEDTQILLILIIKDNKKEITPLFIQEEINSLIGVIKLTLKKKK